MDRRAFLLQSSSALATLAWINPLTASALTAEPPLRSLLQRETPLTRIAFGSCNRGDRSQSYWNYVLEDRPDLWIWLGDNIYADFLSPKDRAAAFQRLKSNPYYQTFAASTAIVGTWDDHDYAYNNADSSYSQKDASKKVLLDFLDVDAGADVWSRDGVYQSYEFGPAGQKTKVILMDLRWDMIKNGSRRRLLSDAQWSWLEAEIRGNSADLIVIASSLNVTSPFTMLGMEGWGHYPAERERLYALLDEISTPMILLSGDRHFAEMYRQPLPSGRVIYEIMSSGLTHAAGIKLPHPGRLVEMVGRKNYGLMEIDWSGPSPQVLMQIRASEYYGSYQRFGARFERPY